MLCAVSLQESMAGEVPGLGGNQLLLFCWLVLCQLAFSTSVYSLRLVQVSVPPSLGQRKLFWWEAVTADS